MKYFLFIFLIVLKVSLLAQNSSSNNPPSYYHITVYPTLGIKMLQKPVLSRSLNSVSHFNFTAPILYRGGSISFYFHLNPWLTELARLSVLQVIPKEITLNDNTKANISGMNFGMTLYGGEFKRAKTQNFNLFLMLGFNTGWLKISNSYISQKNPYFSPKINLAPKLRISNFFILIEVEYEFDVSNPAWKKIKPQSLKLQPNNQSLTGLTSLVSIGYLFKYKESSPAKKKKRRI